MDLASILRTKIQTLPQGDYTTGLKAVLLHIETASKHLAKGQLSRDEQHFFTDAIYRTNQAFEGSIKEAFRVLTGQSPNRKTPFEIESYLADNSIFKPRVLSQFTTYRTQWRNPSAHDYTLEFDESEAFLAIASVSAFACVLIDQIAEKVAFSQTSKEAEKLRGDKRLPDDNEPAPLADILVCYLMIFNRIALTLPITTQSQLCGSVRGFLSSIAPSYNVVSEAELVPGQPDKADLIVTHRDEKVAIELNISNTQGAFVNGTLHLEHLMDISGISAGILFLYYPNTVKLHAVKKSFNDRVIHALVPIKEDVKSQDQVSTAKQNISKDISVENNEGDSGAWTNATS